MKSGWNRCKKVPGVLCENIPEEKPRARPGDSRDEDVEVFFGSNKDG